MQDALFPDLPSPAAPPAKVAPAPSPRKRSSKPQAADPGDACRALAATLPPALHLGTSSWSYPGWAGLVWAGEHSESRLSKHGLPAYAQHPLLRTVSIDRSFYRALGTAEYATYAAQVPADFRFVVKAPSAVTDAVVRAEDGRGVQPNPLFLNPELAVQDFVQPALDGLGQKLGALVFQLSPLPLGWLADLPAVLERLRTMLAALPSLAPQAPDGVVAVEVRDPEFLTPDFAAVLRETGATYCLGLHAKMPPIEQQLPLLRALWPGPLVCRWNLHPRHGSISGYAKAQEAYAPYDRLHDEDLPTREALARVIAGTVRHGQKAYVTVSNHAEGCAPRSVEALAQVIAHRLQER
jgi:uncharacterized protein YecE (DUF72 family)